MCMTTVPQPNRIKCPTVTNNTTYPSIESFVNVLLSSRKENCTYGNTLTSIIISEMDTNNNFHEMRFNISGEIDFSDDNMSLIPFPNTIWCRRPTWEVVTKSSLFLPIVIGGIISNLILLNIVVSFKRMQTPTNILIAAMAIVDLVTLITCPWMLLVHNFYQNYELGAFGCKLEGFLSGALLITGVMLLSAVSYDRLTVIVLPREARLTKAGAYKLAALAVTLGILFASPLCIYRTYKERQWKNFLESYCTENYKILPMYWHVLLSTMVWFPITVMTICYSAIFWKLDRYEKQILRREHPISVNYKMRVARTLFIVLIVFIICRIPFTVLVFLRNKMMKEAQINAVNRSFQILWFISHYLIYLNCAINPIIYGLTNVNYKRALCETKLYKWFSCKEGNDKKIKPQGKNSFVSWLWPFGRKNVNLTEVNGCKQKKFENPEIICSKIIPLGEDYI